MYFVFEIEFSSNKSYLINIIRANREKHLIDIDIIKSEDKIILISKTDEPKLEEFLKSLELNLPASIYLGGSREYLSDKKPEFKKSVESDLPLDISLCPSCQKEMFDKSSRRYYYPFTACRACGSSHAFLDKYPLTRKNSTMRFLNPCLSCKDEMHKNPLRRGYPLISCTDCGIVLNIRDRDNQRYANDKKSYKKLFALSAKAIVDGKSILFKTTFGYRKFFKPTVKRDLKNSILLMANASMLNKHLVLITQEFNALLSIERPILRVATKSVELKELYGSNTLCKYPDDGMSMLLAREIIDAGLDFVSYIECDEGAEADMVVDFDIPIRSQKDFKLFINQDTKFIISGERSIFPQLLTDAKEGRVTVANGLVSSFNIIDKIDYFNDIKAETLLIKNGEQSEIEAKETKFFEGFKASMLSILAEHKKLDEKGIGVYFDDRLYFLYYNKREVIPVVSSKALKSDNLFENLSTLREGSNRLVKNFREKFPTLCKRLDGLSGEKNLFDIVAIVLELEDESFDGISSSALKFMGKGGLQVDTKIENNYFDNYAFLASIMSYKMTDVDTSLLCYSIYESFGDYISEIVNQLMDKTEAKTLTLNGKSFANQALWSRVKRNLALKKPLLNIEYPIGKESEVYGANFI